MCRSGRERDSGERKSDGEVVKSERMKCEMWKKKKKVSVVMEIW